MYNYVQESIICKVKLTLWRIEAMMMALRREDPRNNSSFSNGTLPNSVAQCKGSKRKGTEEQLVERIRRISSLSHEDFIKMKDAEQQDDFFTTRKARDITNPDTKGDGHSSLLSIKIVPNSFRRLLGVKEICSKQGTFLHRTIDLPHKPGDALGFLIRQGDGWSRTDGIFISRLVLGTDVDNYELFRVGDEIIRVNKVDVRGMNVEDVSALMQMAKRLIITVKVLTPLSKKKLLALSNANSLGRARVGQAISPRTGKAPPSDRLLVPSPNDSWRGAGMSPTLSHRSNYKIANLAIGKANDNKGTQSPHLLRSRSVGRSPTPGRRPLSPIRETMDQTEPNSILTKSNGARRKSFSSGMASVSWSDQVPEHKPMRSKSFTKLAKDR